MAKGYVEDKEEAKEYLERISYFYTPNTEQLMELLMHYQLHNG